MGVDRRLVVKGRREPRVGLAQEAKVHVQLGKDYLTELGEHGWSAQDTADLEANFALLDGAMGTQSGARTGAKGATRTEKQAAEAAKKYIARLRRALPRALRDAPDLGLTMASFAAGETLATSTPKISKYLSTIRSSVEKADKALARAFPKKSALTLLDEVKKALDDADVTQEVAKKNAPDTTQALYEVAGKVVEQIEDMNRAGLSAFEGDPQARAKFNKEILERARKKAKKTAAAKAKPAKDAKAAKDAKDNGAAPTTTPAAPNGTGASTTPAATTPATPTAPGGTGASPTAPAVTTPAAPSGTGP